MQRRMVENNKVKSGGGDCNQDFVPRATWFSGDFQSVDYVRVNNKRLPGKLTNPIAFRFIILSIRAIIKRWFGVF